MCPFNFGYIWPKILEPIIVTVPIDLAGCTISTFYLYYRMSRLVQRIDRIRNLWTRKMFEVACVRI